MTVYNLSHPINEKSLLFPGTPPLRLAALSTIQKDGYRETSLTLTSHVGTHMDSPAHLLETGLFLDQFPPDKFWDTAYIFDAQHIKNTIEPEDFEPFIDKFQRAGMLLIFTGYGSLWPNVEYLHNFPVLSEKAALRLTEFNFKIIGMDTMSFDPIASTQLPIHLILLGKKSLLLENVNIPKILVGTTVELVVGPLPIEQADGAPVQIWAKK
ncbi:cyclase family protein [bacterium]|nr:cyclase family protein [bacterium]